MTLTEADLAAIEARAEAARDYLRAQLGGFPVAAMVLATDSVPALIAALRAAWAERDEWKERFTDEAGRWGVSYAELVRDAATLEAERDRLRAEFVEADRQYTNLLNERDEFRSSFQALLETTRRDRAALREIRAVAESDARGWNDWARVAGVVRAALTAPDASDQEETR